MSWAQPILELFAGAMEFVASLPEKDRQKAIDRMQAAHKTAVDELAAFARDSAADLEAARKTLDDDSEG